MKTLQQLVLPKRLMRLFTELYTTILSQFYLTSPYLAYNPSWEYLVLRWFYRGDQILKSPHALQTKNNLKYFNRRNQFTELTTVTSYYIK